MLLVLNKKLKSYRFKDYVFLPDKPVEVIDDNDIYDLLVSNKVIEVSDTNTFRDRFKGLFGPDDGQLSIGIIRIGGIGDTLQLGAHAKAIKRKYPGCYITAFVRDKPDQQVLESNSSVDRIIQTGLSNWDKIVDKHHGEYDIFYDFKYIAKVFYNKDGFKKHKEITDKRFNENARYYHDFTDSNYELSQRIKKNVIDISNESAALEGSPDDIELTLQFSDSGFSRLLEGDKYVTMHIGAGNFRVTKLWDLINWIKVVEYLKKQGFKVVQLGNGYEPEVSGAMSLLGLTSIGQSAYLLANARFHIGTESGMVHLAKAVKTPSVVLFGATPVSSFGYKENINIRKCKHPACWYSWDDWYMKCRKSNSNRPECMGNISVTNVTEAIDEMIERTKKRKSMPVTHKRQIDISVITPVLNGQEWFRQEVNSLFAYSKGVNFEFIVIDNGSNEAMKRYLKTISELPNIKLITNEKNLGFGKANNQGSRVARGRILLFLNSDVRVGSNFLQDINEAFNRDNGLAATGACGGILDSNINCLGETRRNSDKWDYLVGWCLAIKKDVFEKIGGFDEQYGYGYCEDTDLSYKLKHDGYKIKISEGLKIHHYANKTAFRQKDFDPYLLTMQNHQKFKEKWLLKKPAGKVNKICVIRTGGLGDVLLTFPILKELKNQHPGSQLTYVTSDFCSELLKGCKLIDRVSTNTIYAKEKFDMILEPKYEHSPKRYLETMAESIGIEVHDKRLFYDITEQDRKYARNILKDGPAVCFHTGRTWKCREWSMLKFKEVADYIIREYGFQIIELGRPDTLKMGVTGSIDLRGKVNYSQLAGILAESELFVGIDSFCLHLAMAAGTPVLGIYGATVPELVEAEGSRSYPVRIKSDCSGCRHRTPGVFVNCNNPHCMKDISSSMVVNRVNEALNYV
jgi:ADP-heptose:LPS heptosyltransferase